MVPNNGNINGMGPMLRSDGVAFRVWAPHARKVSLVGTFNAWNSSHHVMEREGNGYWYAKVPEATKGHEYRYLLTTPAGKLWRIDPYARQVTDSNGNAVVHDPDFDWEGDNFRMPPWNELVVYEMHVGTFHVPHNCGDQPGTFATAAARLKHLAELGVNAIELMPVAEFEGGRSWGYNPSCLFAVETAYGGSRAFKAFVKECRQHGIAVILDVVYNHLGPNSLDLWRFDGWHHNDLGGIYFYNDGRARTPWGHTRPDYGRPEVRRFLRDNALMWLEEYHVDGLRCDSTFYNPLDQRVRAPGHPRRVGVHARTEPRDPRALPRPDYHRRGSPAQPAAYPRQSPGRCRLREPVGRSTGLRAPGGRGRPLRRVPAPSPREGRAMLAVQP